MTTSRALTALLVLFFTASCFAGITVNLVPPVIEKVVKTGTRIQDAISFTNQGTVVLDVTVDTADFAFDSHGIVTDRTPGTEISSIAQYVRISPLSIRVGPKQRVYFRYSIETPPQFLQLRGKVYFTCKPVLKDGGANRVTIVPRLGVALYVENRDAKPAALIVNAVQFKRAPENGDRLILDLDLVNQGDRNIRPKGFLQMESKDGGYKKTFEFNEGKEPVLPSQRRNWQLLFEPVSQEELSLKLHFTTSFRNSFEAEYAVPASKKP